MTSGNCSKVIDQATGSAALWRFLLSTSWPMRGKERRVGDRKKGGLQVLTLREKRVKREKGEVFALFKLFAQGPPPPVRPNRPRKSAWRGSLSPRRRSRRYPGIATLF